MRPGITQLTVMPSRATSRDSVFDQPTSESLSALEIPRFGIGATTPELVFVMMRPQPRARMRSNSSTSAASASKSARADGEEDEGADQQLPKLEQDEQVATREIKSARKETKPPRRYSDASLLAAMWTLPNCLASLSAFWDQTPVTR